MANGGALLGGLPAWRTCGRMKCFQISISGVHGIFSSFYIHGRREKAVQNGKNTFATDEENNAPASQEGCASLWERSANQGQSVGSAAAGKGIVRWPVL